MKNSHACLLIAPEALRRGWTGWILSGATARTGGLELVWAGVLDAPGGSTGLLVFRGEDAAGKLSAAVGSIDQPGSLAAMLGEGMVTAGGERELRELAATQGSSAISRPVAAGTERSLVLIKPDNFVFPGTRAGAVLDVFARTGVQLIAMKVHHMSVAEGMAFYGPVLEALTGLLGAGPGRERWENLIAFMSGSRPSDLPVAEHSRPGTQKILALVFEGPGAVAKIRAVLGPTDPAKAPPGTIRKEFGTSMMINAAHASDSPENANREIGILPVGDNLLKGFVESAGGAA